MSATTFTTQRQLMVKGMPKMDASNNMMLQQQKIMLYLFPVIFAISGVNFPVGVLIYWSTTNLWTWGQQYYVIKRNPTPGSPAYEELQRKRKEKIKADGKDAEGMLTDGDLQLFMNQKGTMIYFLPLLHRNQVSFDITVLSDDPTWSPEITNDYLLRRLEGFDPRLIEITRNLDMSKLNCRAGYDLDSIPNWHSDCVALLGDACHAMLWHQGQGANTAVMDAGGLADALEQADSVKDALALYQSLRKPVTDELQAISRQSWDADAIETAFPGQQSQR
jgi:2-polyprenyl-6-methoxyphenol hydroxylase-like FAD-dependent oxidoreductase